LASFSAGSHERSECYAVATTWSWPSPMPPSTK
jgi:hypothetical protein